MHKIVLTIEIFISVFLLILYFMFLSISLASLFKVTKEYHELIITSQEYLIPKDLIINSLFNKLFIVIIIYCIFLLINGIVRCTKGKFILGRLDYICGGIYIVLSTIHIGLWVKIYGFNIMVMLSFIAFLLLGIIYFVWIVNYSKKVLKT